MKTIVRVGLFLICAIQFVFAVGFCFQWGWATAFWPFPGTTPLTYIFVGSITAAAAASTLWVAVTENYGALVGIALDYMVILAPTALFVIVLGAQGGGLPMYLFGVLGLLGALFGLALLAWSAFQPLDRSQPTPRPVLVAFVVFIIALLIVSTRLILRIPNSLPWAITPDLSVVIGLMFLGAAFYFVYGLLRPSWANAGGQLAGFLAYDLVLIGPFLARLPGVAPEHRVGLFIYTAVVAFSGLLAFYYLFIHRTTRVWGRQRQRA